jgi:hypothetical protein
MFFMRSVRTYRASWSLLGSDNIPDLYDTQQFLAFPIAQITAKLSQSPSQTMEM